MEVKGSGLLGQTIILIMLLIFVCINEWGGIPFPLVGFTILIAKVIGGFNKSGAGDLLIFTTLISTLSGHSYVTPLVYRLLLGTEQKLLPKCWIRDITSVTIKWWDMAVVTWCSPVYGANAYVPGMEVITDLAIRAQGIFEELSASYFQVSEQRATYIREIGINNLTVPIPDLNIEPASNVLQRYNELAGSFRKITFAVLAIALTHATGFMGVLVMALIYYLTMLEEAASIQIEPRNRGSQVRDGVYQVENRIFGFLVSHGIGVGYQGIFHAPHHVTLGNDLLIGKTRYKVYYRDEGRDLDTYGGPPQITTPSANDEIYINCETVDSRTTYWMEKFPSSSEGTYAYPSVTKPGESGSPIFSATNEGDLRLVGLAGRYVDTVEGVRTEFAIAPNYKEQEKTWHEIAFHPGYGKTRKVLPEILLKELARNKRKILVTGPTRVVCSEMYGALSKKFSLGLNVRGMNGRDRHARIQLAAHRTSLRMLEKGDLITHNVGCIIIDEAHFDDAGTKLLIEFARYLNRDHGTVVYLMSATLPDQEDENSNFPITEHQMSKREIIPSLQEALERGEKSMLFVPGATGKQTHEIMKALAAHKPILLSRKTLQSVAKSIKEPENLLIVSTDISECGINVPGLINVFDFGEKFMYVHESGVVHSAMVRIDKASRIQRKGRIGRSAPGNYYYVPGIRTSAVESSSEYDCQVLMAGREWAEPRKYHGYSLSQKQYEYWLENDVPPMQAYLEVTASGTKVKKQDLPDRIRTLLAGDIAYEGCGIKNCQCRGHYLGFDERCHDWLVKPQ